jgi:ElaB/YqjD/DUF883 family membrane-anchored ribosome-binding protein
LILPELRRLIARRVEWRKMMNDTLEARVTEVGKAIGDGVQGATAATAAAAGQAQKVLDDAGEVAAGVVDAGCRATRSVSRQIEENPFIAVLVGCALGYVAGWWIRGRR